MASREKDAMMVRSNAYAERGDGMCIHVEKGKQGRRSPPEIIYVVGEARCGARRAMMLGAVNVEGTDGCDCHETMQPFVNHQLLFNCSIQCTTKRRRSSGDFTGRSLAFSVSSMGSAMAIQ